LTYSHLYPHGFKSSGPGNHASFKGFEKIMIHGKCEIDQAKREGDADMDLKLIDEVRNLWQFYRNRRPEPYKNPLTLIFRSIIE